MINSPAASTVYLSGSVRKHRKRTEPYTPSSELAPILLTITSSTQRRALCAIDKYGIEMVNFKNGFTALHWAAKANRADVCKYLLSRKADPSVLDDQRKTPFDYANRLDVKELLRPGPRKQLLKDVVDLASLPVTHRACLETIAEHGWSSLRWGGGWTILHWAYQHDRQDVIQYLRSAGVPMDIPDDKGRLPLDYSKNPKTYTSR
jgi:hypothetical protein